MTDKNNDLERKQAECTNESVEERSDNTDDETITLYVYPRKLVRNIIPNVSPPALKLETWLRLKKLPFGVIESMKGSKTTGLTPYVMYKGEEITDSGIIMRELTKRLGLDPTEGLTAEELAVSRAFQKMVDENTYWTGIWQKFVNCPPEVFHKFAEIPGPKFANGIILKMLKRKYTGRMAGQGMGLLPREEIVQIAKDDISALSNFLGDKQFMMGDTPTSLDCSVFGMLCQFVYIDIPSPHKEVMEQHCPNIVPYMDRVKAATWPDWDEICGGKLIQ